MTAKLVCMGDSTRYPAFHLRLTKVRGRARNMKCALCDRQAAGWSYNHSDPNPVSDVLQSGRTAVFSLDMSRYDPLCRRCHAERDRGELLSPEEARQRRLACARRSQARGDGRVLTAQEIEGIQALLAQGVAGNQIARDYRVSAKRVYNIRDRGAPKITNLGGLVRMMNDAVPEEAP